MASSHMVYFFFHFLVVSETDKLKTEMRTCCTKFDTCSFIVIKIETGPVSLLIDNTSRG